MSQSIIFFKGKIHVQLRNGGWGCKEMVNMIFNIWQWSIKFFKVYFVNCFELKIYCEVKKKKTEKIESYCFFWHFVFHVARPPGWVMSESWRMRCMSLVVNSISFEVNCNLTVNCYVIWFHRSCLSFGNPERHLKKIKIHQIFKAGSGKRS